MHIVAFLIFRSAQALLVMVAILAALFFVQSGPVDSTAAPGVFLADFARFAERALAGDLGMSAALGRPALELVLERLPASLDLLLAAGAIFLVLAVPAGALSALCAAGAVGRLLSVVSVLFVATPVFLIGILLAWLFGMELGLLPLSGRGEAAMLSGLWVSSLATEDGRVHAILPAATLAAMLLGAFIPRVIIGMRQMLLMDHARYAHARGLSPRRVRLVHGLRSMLPGLLRGAGLGIGALFAATILVETVFQWPGLGLLLLEGAKRGDLPLVLACVLVIGLIVLAWSVLVDVLHLLIAPRPRVAGGAA